MIDVVCAIIEHEGKVLVTRRGEGMDLAGKWEFPGGKLHAGEPEMDALVREIREELNLEVDPHRRLHCAYHEYPDKTVRLIPFICSLVAGELRLTEHSEHRWCGLRELHSLDWAAADIPVVKQLLNFC